MWDLRTPAVLAVVLCAIGCASTPPAQAPPEIAAPVARDCRVARTTGDVTALLRASGELVVVGGGVELLRSVDDGRSWTKDALPLRCGWPDITEIDGRLLVSCSERSEPKRLLVMTERSGGGWSSPVRVDVTNELNIDTNLQPLPGGGLLLFATHIDRPDDLDDAVYTLRAFRSPDGGMSWSAPENVVVGRRGEHVEDSRSTVLADGTLLLAYEIETAEGAPSMIFQHRSGTDGESWSTESLIWSGADVEPGGYLSFPDGELWFIASTDGRAGTGSYDRSTLEMRRSADDGRSWADPEVLVDLEDQISFGGVLLPGGEILLPSVRHYSHRKRRQLSLYLVDRDLSGAARCAVESMSADGFEDGLGPQWIKR